MEWRRLIWLRSGKLNWFFKKLDNAILDDLQDEGAMERDMEEADEFKLKSKKTIDKIDAVLAPTSRGLPISLGHAPSETRSMSLRPKLPKLTIKKFEGDITTWKSFWDIYESAVHNNEELSDINKFTYLRSLVGHSTKDAIEGLALTPANYGEVVAILQKRFGNDISISLSIWRPY